MQTGTWVGGGDKTSGRGEKHTRGRQSKGGEREKGPLARATLAAPSDAAVVAAASSVTESPRDLNPAKGVDGLLGASQRAWAAASVASGRRAQEAASGLECGGGHVVGSVCRGCGCVEGGQGSGTQVSSSQGRQQPGQQHPGPSSWGRLPAPADASASQHGCRWHKPACNEPCHALDSQTSLCAAVHGCMALSPHTHWRPPRPLKGGGGGRTCVHDPIPGCRAAAAALARHRLRHPPATPTGQVGPPTPPNEHPAIWGSPMACASPPGGFARLAVTGRASRPPVPPRPRTAQLTNNPHLKYSAQFARSHQGASARCQIPLSSSCSPGMQCLPA